jgi:hypothetical protein
MEVNVAYSDANPDKGGPVPRHIAVSSPNKPRPHGITLEVAQLLGRIERNYSREGSGPGSRFEGRLLEDVQAEAALRRFAQHILGYSPAKMGELLKEMAVRRG